MPDAIQQDEEDVVHYAGSDPAANPTALVAPANASPAGDATYGWAYAPPSHLEGEPGIQPPAAPPGAEVPANQAFRLPSGVVAFRETQAYHDRLQTLDQQARAARVARDQAARDAQMLDQMMRVAHSTKDIEVALQQQDVIGFRNAVAGGTPSFQALQQFPRAATSPLVAAMRAAQPAPATTWVPPTAGAPGYIRDPRGNPHFPPGSEPMMAAPTPEDLGGGVTGLRVSPQHYQVLKSQDMTAAQEISALRARAALKEQQFMVASPKKGSAEEKDFLDTLTKIDKRLEELSSGNRGKQTPTKATPAALTRDQAVEFLRQANGDKEKARKLARDAGLTF